MVHRGKTTVLAALVAILLVMSPSTASVLAAPPGQEVLVEITSPRMGATLRGPVQIIGSASIPNFQFYKVEYASASTPTTWTVINTTHQVQIVKSVLEVWNTTTVPDGTYNLHLVVVDVTGNFKETPVIQVMVANAQPTEAPTPTVTPTEVLMPTVTVVIPVPVSPSHTPAPPPTPLPTRTSTTLPGLPDLVIDLSGLSIAFCAGAAAMGVIFLLVGMLALLRRL